MSELPDDFDPAYYLLAHGEVAEAGMDAAEHYLKFGRDESRTGVPPRLLHTSEREAQGRADFFANAFSAIAVNGIAGPYLEFGVGRGMTLWLAWRTSRALGVSCDLWAFDSFEGLPAGTTEVDTSHPAWLPGAYANSEASVSGNLTALGVDLADIRFVPGFYSDSVAPGRRPELPTSAALVYIDCDMYDSTVDALDYLAGVIGHGTIVGFDDYFCWSPSRTSGEQLALQEFQAAHPELTFHPYQPIGWHGMSFYVTTD
jgi:O-methyltransferase